MIKLTPVKTVQYSGTWADFQETILSFFRRDTQLKDDGFYDLVCKLFGVQFSEAKYFIIKSSDNCKISLFYTEVHNLHAIPESSLVWGGIVSGDSISKWFKDQDIIIFHIDNVFTQEAVAHAMYSTQIPDSEIDTLSSTTRDLTMYS